MKIHFFLLMSLLMILTASCGDQRSRAPITGPGTTKTETKTDAVTESEQKEIENCTATKAVKKTFKAFRKYKENHSDFKDKDVLSVVSNNSLENHSHSESMNTVLLVEFDSEKRLFNVKVDMKTCAVKSIEGRGAMVVDLDGNELK